MIIKRRGGRTWVYIEAEGTVADDIRAWRDTGWNRHAPSRVAQWLKKNVDGGWTVDAKIRRVRGDERYYLAIRFDEDDHAVLFQLSFDQNTPHTLKDAWTPEQRADPKANTFTRTNGWRGWDAKPKTRGPLKGKTVGYLYSTERNAAGYFLGTRTVDGWFDPEPAIARRRKKDVIAWALRKSEE